MTGPPSVIDLGEDFDAPRDAVFATGSARAWFRRAIPVLAVLLVVAASARPPVPPIAVTARVPVGLDATIAVTGDEAIVVDIRGGHNEIGAYRLDGGALIWSSPLRVLASDVDVTVVDGVAVVTMPDMAATGTHTQAFDARSGTHLWDSDDGLLQVSRFDELVMRTAATDAVDLRYLLVDPRTGSARWQIAIASGCQTALGDDLTRGLREGMAELCPDPGTGGTGTLRIIDMTNGTVIARRGVDLGSYGPFSSFTGAEAQLSFWNSVVLVARQEADLGEVEAYDGATLRPLWHGLKLAESDSLQACGPDLCVYRSGGVQVIDPQTGTDVAQAPPDDTTSGAVFVLVPPRDNPAVTAETTVLRVPEGASARFPPYATGAVWLASTGARDALRGGRPDLIQPMRGVAPGGCVQAGVYLACATSPAEITFWRVRPGD